MKLDHICDLKHIHLHGTNFGEEILFYLNKFSMSQKELAQRLGLSTQYVYIIINSKTNVNLSISIIEGLENVFNLELGTLAEVYSIYANKEKVEAENIELLLKNYGEDFIIENPSLPLVGNIKLTKDMSISKKLMIMNRFYGVADLKNYYQYLKENALADESIYANPNSKVWIRFCELSVFDAIKDKQIGVFRKNTFEIIYKKVIKIICNESKTFKQKIFELQNYLLTKGIILITMPFIDKSDIAAITFHKGARRMIFVSDIYNCEAFIFNYILHEITHCFFENKNEEQIDQIYSQTYLNIKNEMNFNYSAIDDGLLAFKKCEQIKHQERKGEICDVIKKVFSKYEKVSF
ncbi:helix-turn-helix domain-containing protein [Metamycoplasma gateae]|uniref:Helix-turn-helix transcriptional regulator n=1 Tax=Metamycoplasma gateae TaxID=35769 RepID=A0ABZ2AKS5_9BACT|nr:helix-turn-helix transcriptional regulator [Metamycoplasma gateae]